MTILPFCTSTVPKIALMADPQQPQDVSGRGGASNSKASLQSSICRDAMHARDRHSCMPRPAEHCHHIMHMHNAHAHAVEIRRATPVEPQPPCRLTTVHPHRTPLAKLVTLHLHSATFTQDVSSPSSWAPTLK